MKQLTMMTHQPVCGSSISPVSVVILNDLPLGMRIVDDSPVGMPVDDSLVGVRVVDDSPVGVRVVDDEQRLAAVLVVVFLLLLRLKYSPRDALQFINKPHSICFVQ